MENIQRSHYISQPSPPEAENAHKKLKSYKSAGTDRILAARNQARG
jgi:hypothetical protein